MKKKLMKFLSSNFSMVHVSDSSSNHDDCFNIHHQKVATVSDLEKMN